MPKKPSIAVTMIDALAARAAMVAVVAMAFVSQASAQNAPNSSDADPTSYDVAGVRLGMTKDEAVAALKKFDPSFRIRNVYSVADGSESGVNVSYDWDVKHQGPAPAFSTRPFIGLSARNWMPEKISSESQKVKNGLTLIQDGHGSYFHYDPSGVEYFLSNISDTAMCNINKQINSDSDDETVFVTLSPTPGDQKVIRISFSKTYCKNGPAISVLEDSLTNKFSKNVTSPPEANDRTDPVIRWRYDNRGRLIDKQRASKLELLDEQYIHDGAGIGLTASLGRDGNNMALTHTVALTLFNEGALFKYREQLHAAVKNLEQEKLKKEAAGATTSPDKTKF